jgi:hypothetical protein
MAKCDKKTTYDLSSLINIVKSHKKTQAPLNFNHSSRSQKKNHEEKIETYKNMIVLQKTTPKLKQCVLLFHSMFKPFLAC